MRKLLVFTESYARGGGNRYMVDLANALAGDFADIVLAANRGGIFSEDVGRLTRPCETTSAAFVTRTLIANRLASAPPLARKAAVKALLVFEPVFFVLNIVLLARLVRRIRPDYVLSCNGGYPASPACLAMVIAAALCRIPATLTVVSMSTPRRTLLWLYDCVVDRAVWSSADRVIVNARTIAEDLVRTHGADASKLSVVHNGVEDLGPPPAGDRRDGEFVVGCVARLDRMKGVLFLLEAFAELAKDRPDAILVLAGEGDAEEDMRARARAMGLAHRVRFLGHFGGDIATLLASFDLFVFPSLWEGFPYSIVEAMRAGKPIVATEVGGIPEAIDDEREGLLIKPGSSGEIVAAARRLMADPALRRSLAHNARARFERDLSLAQMERRVRQVLAGVRPERSLETATLS